MSAFLLHCNSSLISLCSHNDIKRYVFNTKLPSRQEHFNYNKHLRLRGMLFIPGMSLSFTVSVFVLVVHRAGAEPALSLTLHCCMSIHLCLSSWQRHCQTATGQEGCTVQATRTHTYTYTLQAFNTCKQMHIKTNCR